MGIVDYSSFMWYGFNLAMFFPDYDGYNEFLEIEFYWIQHLLLAIIPVYTLSKMKKINWAFDALYCWSVFYGFFLFYTLPIPIVSMYTNTNINSMLTPPKIDIIRSMGPYYRICMNMIIFVLQIASFYMSRVLALLLKGSMAFIRFSIDYCCKTQRTKGKLHNKVKNM